MRLPLFAFLLLLVLLAGVAVVRFVLEPVAARPPNLLLVVLDTVRADRVSFGVGRGRERDTTPFLRSLAAEGTVFLHARANGCWTVPSHASLFTGLVPSEHGCHFEHRYLPQEVETLAEVLRSGPGRYRTAAFSANPNVAAAFGFDQGFDLFEETFAAAGDGADPSTLAADRLAEWAAEDSAQPRFAFLNLMDAHLPYRARPGFEATFGEVPARVREALDDPDLLDEVLLGERRLDEDFVSALELAQDNALRGLDERLRELFDRLRAAGFLDDAVVVVTSDHGENLGDHGLVDHQGGLWESLLRVPLLVWGSDGTGVRRGEVVRRPVSLADVFAIVVDASCRAFDDAPVRPRRPLVAEKMRPVAVLDRLRARAPGFEPGLFGRRERLFLDPESGAARWTTEDGAEAFFRVEGDAVERRPFSPPSALASSLRARTTRFDAARRVVRETGRRRAAPRGPSPDARSLSQLGYTAPSSGAGDLHASIHLESGRRAWRAGDAAAAVRQWRLAALLDPRDPRPLYALAEAKERRDPKGAVEAWRRYLDLALEVGDDPDRLRRAMEKSEESRAGQR